MFDRHVIETPENISFSYQVAGIGSRFLAVMVDTLIQGAIYLVLLILALVLQFAAPSLGLPPEIGRVLPTLMVVLVWFLVFVVQFGYFIVFELTMGGQTPGKELLGIRVIKENGYPLTAMDTVIRNLVRIIDFFPLGYGVGVITMFLNSRAKRLGDYAAGTIVVRVGEQVKLADLKRAVETPEAVAEWPGVERLGEADVELIESYLNRRFTLDNADALGATLVDRVRRIMNTRQADEYAATHIPATFLKEVAAAYRAQARH